ncbi:MAG TPA: STAS domain-containing protein [Conexibacter sp.]|nr:STAS domain-containing protein [Conexibacter sp.]
MPDTESIDVQPFRLTTHPRGERAVVELHGELDLGTVETVDREVRELRERGTRAIVLDMRPLAFIDSSGLRLLLRLDADARAHGLGFAIAEGDGPVRRLLELTSLTDDFEHAEL